MKIIDHTLSFICSLILSYFFFPGNLSSPTSILILLICNFVTVELYNYLFKGNKKNQ